MKSLTELGQTAGALLKEQSATIVVAESSSGGLVSAALLSVPGASAYFKGGGVIYTRDARRALLGVPEDIVTMDGATEEYAALVAEAARAKLDATWSLCETGASGPTGSRYGHAAGHVALAVAGPAARSATIETGSDDREANMWRFAEEALTLLEAALRDAAKG